MLSSIQALPFGCTDFQFALKDHTPICGRNMDFPNIEPMKSRLSVHTIGEKWTSKAPGQADGISWEVQIGFIGISAFSDSDDPDFVDDVVDGINQNGLSGAVLTLNNTQYQNVPASGNARAITQMDLLSFLLGTCSTVQDVQAAIQNLYVWGAPFAPFPTPPGFHYAFHDKAGNNLVVEYPNGAPQCYPNPIGVLTNDPPFPLQLAELAKYTYLSAQPQPNTVINGVTIPSPGLGSGTIGLPGSTDASSRFVTIAKLIEMVQTNAPIVTVMDGITKAQSLLGRVHVIEGEKMAIVGENTYFDRTLWSVIKVLGEQLRLIYFSENDCSLHEILLKGVDFTSANTRHAKVPVGRRFPTFISDTDLFNPIKMGLNGSD